MESGLELAEVLAPAAADVVELDEVDGGGTTVLVEGSVLLDEGEDEVEGAGRTTWLDEDGEDGEVVAGAELEMVMARVVVLVCLPAPHGIHALKPPVTVTVAVSMTVSVT